jgi:hypothetical protein
MYRERVTHTLIARGQKHALREAGFETKATAFPDGKMNADKSFIHRNGHTMISNIQRPKRQSYGCHRKI